MYPALFKKHVDVYTQKEKNRVIEQDILNHILGRYIGFAVNDPKSYPRQAILDRAKMPKAMTPEQMHKVFKRLADKIKDKPKT